MSGQGSPVPLQAGLENTVTETCKTASIRQADPHHLLPMLPFPNGIAISPPGTPAHHSTPPITPITAPSLPVSPDKHACMCTRWKPSAQHQTISRSQALPIDSSIRAAFMRIAMLYTVQLPQQYAWRTSCLEGRLPQPAPHPAHAGHHLLTAVLYRRHQLLHAHHVASRASMVAGRLCCCPQDPHARLEVTGHSQRYCLQKTPR
jgi:hypothetical protein